MANPHRGEVALEVEGENYTLRYSSNALAELEDALDASINEISDLLNDERKIRIKHVRALLWAALRDEHENVTIRQAGDLLDRVGHQAVMDHIGRAFVLTFPQSKEGANGKSRPRKAKGQARLTS